MQSLYSCVKRAIRAVNGGYKHNMPCICLGVAYVWHAAKLSQAMQLYMYVICGCSIIKRYTVKFPI